MVLYIICIEKGTLSVSQVGKYIVYRHSSYSKSFLSWELLVDI